MAPEDARRAVGGALTKLISASIGDLCVVMSKSPAHKHYALADIEWKVLPPVLTGQVYVAEMMHKENGARAPVAGVLWASVSEETDKRLSENPGQRPRLRPDEWKGGEQLWIIDLAGDPASVAGSLKHLAANEFKDKPVKMLMRDPETGVAREAMLNDVVAGMATKTSGAGAAR